jgi:hypothetical protein
MDFLVTLGRDVEIIVGRIRKEHDQVFDCPSLELSGSSGWRELAKVKS